MLRFLPRSFTWIIGLLLCALVAGCGTANVHVYQYIEKGAAYPRTVAVLPFSFDPEIAEGKRPHRILREVFFNFFSYLGYTDLPLATVDHKLARSAQAGTNPADIPYDQLRKILGTDAVIRGHLIDATNFSIGIYAETSIRAKLEMIDLRSGKVLWEVEHTELNNSSIVTPALVDIIKDQIENFEVKKAYYKASESFAIKVLRGVPDPASMRQDEIQLPRIVSIETNIRGNNKLEVGDLIYVTLQGEPGLTAYFDIGSFKSRVPMKEISPGLYTGSYRIKAGDLINSALIIGSLTNSQGLTAKKFYKGAVAIVEEARAPTEINP